MKIRRRTAVLSMVMVLGAGSVWAAAPGVGGPARPVRPGRAEAPGQARMAGERGGPGGEVRGPGGVLPGRAALAEAGATEEQIEAVEELRFKQQQAAVDQRAAIERATLTLRRLMQSDDPDEQAVMEAADVLTSARGEQVKERLSAQIRVRQILGDEILGALRRERSERPVQGDGGVRQRQQDEVREQGEGLRPRAEAVRPRAEAVRPQGQRVRERDEAQPPVRRVRPAGRGGEAAPMLEE